MKYNFLDLFSGIGGFRLGAKWAGVEIAKEFHSDVDEYALMVYKKNFTNSIALGDITKIDFDKLKNENKTHEWIITGGFPCQDISCAGKRKGIHAERSGLFFEMVRAISILQPRVCIFENVSELLIPGNFNCFLQAVAEIGYDAEWESISAEEVGAWHKRERIWIVARKSCDPNSVKLLHMDNETAQNKWGVIELENYERHKKKWSIEPGMGRMAHGVPDWMDRIRCLGNSVVPQIPFIIFSELINKGII